MTFTLTDLALPIFIGLFSYFANKLMVISKQINEMHEWHAKTDDTGAFVWYGQTKRVIGSLDNIVKHLDANEKTHHEILMELKNLKNK